MLNVAFCDDDYDFLQNFMTETKQIFESMKVPAHFYTFTNGNHLIESFKRYDPYYDIVFLDIDMPAINGKEVARKLRLLDKKFKLVFFTSYDQEAINTFEYDVTGFWPKSRTVDDLKVIVKRVIDRIGEDDRNLQVFRADVRGTVVNVKVPLDDIMYFECVNKSVSVYTQRQTIRLYRYKFSDLIEQYQSRNFVVIHRTCIVNIKYIYSIEEIEIILDSGVHLPLSRRKRGEVLDKFVELVSEDIPK